METLTSLLGAINGVVWGPLMLILLLGVGIYLQIGLKLELLSNSVYGRSGGSPV